MVGMTENLSLELREGEPFGYGDSLMEFQKMQYNSSSEEAKRPNPFDVLYEPHKIHSPSHYNTPLSQSFRYLDMEHNNVMNSDRGVDTSYNNIVTVIDSTDSVNRTGSMISRSATLRNRNRIKTRNKMVRKNDIESDHEKPKRKSKLAFLFPVRRERSLKQKPKYVPLNRSPKFTNAQEFQQFFDKSNAANLLTEMLPPKMNHYKYKRLFLPDPKLITSNAYYQITRNNSFIINPKTQASKMIISLPIKDTFTKNGVKNEPDLDQQLQISDFASEAYNKYRISVFSNKLRTVPTFYQLFPEEANLGMINASELEQINKKLLFEVLLRRTVAAKIGYRLKHSGYFNKKTTNNASSKGHSSSESHSGSSSDTERFDNQNLPKLSKSHTNSSSNDESINTDELLQQNASLYSGVLPSPQISYSSRIELNCLVSEILDSPNFLPLHKSIEKNNISSSSVYSTPKTNKFLNNGKFTPMAYVESPDLLYITKFRKQSNDERNPSKTKPFQSSANDHQLILPETRPKFLQAIIQKSEPELALLGSPNNLPNLKSKRKSQTSSNTSILQDLEDLSSELSSFAVGHEDMVQNFHDSTRDESLNIPKQTHHNLIQSIEESKDSVGLKSTNSTLPIRSESPLADIKSMRASISIIGTLSDSSSNSSSNKKPSLQDAINAHNLNLIEANISTVALKSITSNKGSKLNSPTI